MGLLTVERIWLVGGLAITAVVLLAAFIGLGRILHSADLRRQCQRRTEREGYAIEDFVGYFDQLGVQANTAVEMYRYLQEDWCDISDVPIYPQDNLIEVYGLVIGDELFEIIEEFLDGRAIGLDIKVERTIATVEDLVVELDRLRREVSV